MQRERRENPYPFEWEIAAGAGLAVLLAVPVVGLHLGRMLANLVAGAGLTLPAREELFTSLPALARGDASAGLVPPPTGPLAPTAAVWSWSALATTTLAGLTVWAAVWWWHRHGPGKVLGMATPQEAEKMLGISRLRRQRSVIRPDLYPRRRAADLLVDLAGRPRPDPVREAGEP